MPCKSASYTPSLRVPYVRGIIILKHVNVIWEMTYNNEPNKFINDFNIVLGINITVNNCQSTHTFIGDAAPDHQTLHEHYDLDSSMVESILRRVVTIPNSTLHSSLYITFFQKSFTVLCLFTLHHASRFLTL